MYLVSY